MSILFKRDLAVGSAYKSGAKLDHDGAKTVARPLFARYTTIPNHPGDMPEGTLRAILKQADIDAEKFLQKK